jgi:hypothetical protein
LYEEVWNQHNPEAADECCVDHWDVHLIVEVVDLQARGYHGDPGDGIESLYSPGCNVPITAEEIAPLPDELRFELRGDALYSPCTLPAAPCGRVWTEDYTYVPENSLADQGYRTPAGRGLRALTEGREDGRKRAKEAEIGEGFRSGTARPTFGGLFG